MMKNNRIIYCENLPQNLDMLYSQRQLYSDAKTLLGIEIFITVILSIALSLVSNFFSNNIAAALSCSQDLIKSIVILISILISILDLTLINNYLNNYRKTAASIQDSFDCSVLSIDFNQIKISAPDSETICKYAKKFLSKSSEKHIEYMNNWYYSSKLSNIPLPFAIIMCQRTNCWWDGCLRKKFIKFINTISSVVFIFILVISLINELSLVSFFVNAFAPFLCLLTFTIRQNIQNKTSVANSEKLKNHCDTLWHRCLTTKDINENQLKDLSRKLQDELYQHRSTSPLIFDWFYDKYKKDQETQTNYTLDKMIDEFIFLN